MENQIDQNLENQNLHKTFVKLGNNRRHFANQLLAILPEIFKRGIYKKYTSTIEEYAGKFGSLSKGVVQKRLRLQKYLEDKPELEAAIKTEGVHKVALVASLATAETNAAWADKLKNMSKPAVQELSKEIRYKIENDEFRLEGSLSDSVSQSLFDQDRVGIVKTANCKTTPCTAASQVIKINLDGDLLFLFLKLKKKYGENLNNKELMRKIFEENLDGEEKVQKTKNIKNSKLQSIKVIPGNRNSHNEFQVFNEKKSRYISIHLRRNSLQKTAGKCSYPGCNRPPQIFHHKNRFANSHSHESIIPICKIHHEFVHNGLIQNENKDTGNWQLQLRTGELEKIDQMYRKYRKNNF